MNKTLNPEKTSYIIPESLKEKETRKLEALFRRERLIRPVSGQPSFVDLARAMFHLCGDRDKRPEDSAEEIIRIIGPADKYLFILIDGMGTHTLEKFPGGSIFKSSMVRSLSTIFLSSTSTALTTLATGLWPCSHGVPGWWTYMEEESISAVTLPFEQRNSGKALDELGVNPERLYPINSRWSSLPSGSGSILPAEISGSVFASYASGGNSRRGYSNIEEGFLILSSWASLKNGPGLLYLYLPQIDQICHTAGTRNSEVEKMLQVLASEVEKLAQESEPGWRIIVTADHGQIDVPEDGRLILSEEDKLLGKLRCMPTGEPSVPIFHVRKGKEAVFFNEFIERFGNYFALLTPGQIERLELLGPGSLSAAMRSRIGTFMAIPLRPVTFNVLSGNGDSSSITGTHGGLSPSEMHIPLILI